RGKLGGGAGRRFLPGRGCRDLSVVRNQAAGCPEAYQQGQGREPSEASDHGATSSNVGTDRFIAKPADSLKQPVRDGSTAKYLLAIRPKSCLIASVARPRGPRMSAMNRRRFLQAGALGAAALTAPARDDTRPRFRLGLVTYNVAAAWDLDTL